MAVSVKRVLMYHPANEMEDMMSGESQDETARRLMIEIWDRFHPAILWWSNKDAATDPRNARMVYRELMSGPRGAMDYAARLRPFLTSQPEHVHAID